MPITPTYPGVYVEEIPSGVRTIIGVATSITAFVGRALRGPVNTPRTVTNFGDFEREFGGLWLNNALGYSVADFFRNGGSQAVVVRLYRPALDDQGNPLPGKAKLNVGGMKLEAASEGAWGTRLRAEIDQDVSSESLRLLGCLPRTCTTSLSPTRGLKSPRCIATSRLCRASAGSIRSSSRTLTWCAGTPTTTSSRTPRPTSPRDPTQPRRPRPH